MIKIALALYLCVFAHELGHFVVAKLFKIQVVSVSLFMYPLLYVFFKGTLFRIGFIPVNGYVNAPDIYRQKKYIKIIYFSAGVIMNAAMLCFTDDVVIVSTNIYLIVFSLIPFRNSDGRNIIESL